MPFDAAARRSGRPPNEIRSDIMGLVEEYCDAAHGPRPFVPGNSSVPVSGKVYDSSDVKSLIDASLDFWLTTGRFNEQFEKSLSPRSGSRYALTVNSGSSANLVAFSALTSPLLGERRLQPRRRSHHGRDRFSHHRQSLHACAGMVPVFVDVDIPTYNIDCRTRSRRRSRRRRARSWSPTRSAIPSMLEPSRRSPRSTISG